MHWQQGTALSSSLLVVNWELQPSTCGNQERLKIILSRAYSFYGYRCMGACCCCFNHHQIKVLSISYPGAGVHTGWMDCHSVAVSYNVSPTASYYWTHWNVINNSWMAHKSKTISLVRFFTLVTCHAGLWGIGCFVLILTDKDSKLFRHFNHA